MLVDKSMHSIKGTPHAKKLFSKMHRDIKAVLEADKENIINCSS